MGLAVSRRVLNIKGRVKVPRGIRAVVTLLDYMIEAESLKAHTTSLGVNCTCMDAQPL